MLRFGDVVRNVDISERDPLANGLKHYVGLEHIDPESLHIKRWGQIEDGTSFTRKFVRGQVLFGKRRAYQRKVAFAEFDGICSGDILVFEAKDDLLPELLPFIVQSDPFYEHALSTSAGSLSPRTKWKELATYEFALPPKEEQRRIADILWAADEAIQKYIAVKHHLQVLRRTLVIAFLGLDGATVQFLEVVKGQKKITSKGWHVETISSIGSLERKCVQVGPFGSAVSSAHFTASGTPILKINNITDDGRLNLSDLLFVSDEYAKSLAKYTVQEGDLLTAAQATTGRSTLVTRECEGSLISQHLIRVSVDRSKCDPRYLLACFLSPLILQQISMVKQKTTRDGLNTQDVENFRIPLPHLEEQHRFVGLLDNFDHSLDKLDNYLDTKKSLLSVALQHLLI